jgi:hypothetical protein
LVHLAALHCIFAMSDVKEPELELGDVAEAWVDSIALHSDGTVDIIAAGKEEVCDEEECMYDSAFVSTDAGLRCDPNAAEAFMEAAPPGILFTVPEQAQVSSIAADFAASARSNDQRSVPHAFLEMFNISGNVSGNGLQLRGKRRLYAAVCRVLERAVGTTLEGSLMPVWFVAYGCAAANAGPFAHEGSKVTGLQDVRVDYDFSGQGGVGAMQLFGVRNFNPPCLPPIRCRKRNVREMRQYNTSKLMPPYLFADALFRGQYDNTLLRDLSQIWKLSDVKTFAAFARAMVLARAGKWAGNPNPKAVVRPGAGRSRGRSVRSFAEDVAVECGVNPTQAFFDSGPSSRTKSAAAEAARKAALYSASLSLRCISPTLFAERNAPTIEKAFHATVNGYICKNVACNSACGRLVTKDGRWTKTAWRHINRDCGEPAMKKRRT